VESRSTPIEAPLERALEWHARPGSLRRSWPAWLSAGDRGGLRSAAPGERIRLRMQGLAECGEQQSGVRWELRAPLLGAWTHRLCFSVDEDGCRLEESASASGLARGLAQRILAFRAQRLAGDLTHALEPMRIAVTGASGLVGSELVAFLTAGGHRVQRLVRSEPRAADEVGWDPEGAEIDAAALEGVDAVVHLAGENIASGRWTAPRRARILGSRAAGTRLLATTLARLRTPPRVFVSASAVGFYGDTADALVDESSPSGSGFLAEVCRAWEAGAAPARDAGIRVVHPRLGIVLSAAGGVLGRLAPIFRAGLGGPVGSGAQQMSWISSDDALDVLLRCISDDALSGPINAVAPEPVSNAGFGRALGRVLGRPAIAPLPAALVRLAFGEMGEELLLSGQGVRPSRLLDAGFEFRTPGLEAALRAELGPLSRT
jgi:uncharacterized protein (TIGR01777 family)